MNEITLQFSEIFVTQLLKLQKYNQNISNTILHLHYLCQSYISPCLLLSTKILFLVRTSTYTLSPYLPITLFLPSVIRHSSNKTEFCQPQIESRDHEFLSPFPLLYPSLPIVGSFLPFALASVRVPFSGKSLQYSRIEEKGHRSTRKTASDKQRRGTVYAYREEYQGCLLGRYEGAVRIPRPCWIASQTHSLPVPLCYYCGRRLRWRARANGRYIGAVGENRRHLYTFLNLYT